MRRHFAAVTLLSIAAFILGCGTPLSRTRSQGEADWLGWHAYRIESVAGTNGWTTLVGLHWLKEGLNSAGSGQTNDIVVDTKLPEHLGVFMRKGSAVSFSPAEEVDVRVQGRRIRQVDLVTDASPDPTRLEIGSITIIAIDRGDRMGLRVRDPEAKARREFSGLNYFPYDAKWRLEGRFVSYSDARTMRVPDVTGGFQEYASPGEVVFEAGSAERRLAVALEPGVEDYFIMFRDETAGDSTYPAGRFLYVKKPAPGGDQVVIDFNRAYTPPCGFTDFATCPLPPRQNWLPFPIRAGELKPAGAHH